jgi:cell division septation protein DedD
MDERDLVRRLRPMLLLAAWLLAGAMVLGQVRLPGPSAVASPAARRPSGCWVVQVVAVRGQGSQLAPALASLRENGLPAVVWRSKHWHAIRPGTRLLVVPTGSRTAARTVRARVARLGHHGAVVRQAPHSACRR